MAQACCRATGPRAPRRFSRPLPPSGLSSSWLSRGCFPGLGSPPSVPVRGWPWAAPRPRLRLPGEHERFRHPVAEDGMRGQRSFSAAEDHPAFRCHHPGLVPEPQDVLGAGTCWLLPREPCSQNPLPETDGARANTAEKRQNAVHGAGLSRDTQGPHTGSARAREMHHLPPCLCTRCLQQGACTSGSWLPRGRHRCFDRLWRQRHHLSATLCLLGPYITTDGLKVVLKVFCIGIAEFTGLVNDRITCHNARSPGVLAEYKWLVVHSPRHDKSPQSGAAKWHWQYVYNSR